MRSISQQVLLHAPRKVLRAEVRLPLSKSLSTRALVLNYLSDGKISVGPLSEASDVRNLAVILQQLTRSTAQPTVLDAGEGGAVMRFALALASIRPGKWRLVGSQRLSERPLGILARALQDLGASLEWLGSPGYLPVEIEGKPLSGRVLSIKADESSQHLSALSMIAPMLPDGLQLDLIGRKVSSPYLDMTLSLLQDAGVMLEQTSSCIRILASTFKAMPLNIEPDWSAAAFMYAACALSLESEIFLPGMKRDSLQGDRLCAELFEPLGVKTIVTGHGLLIRQEGVARDFESDLTDCPDMLPTLAVTAAGLHVSARFKGLRHLRIKESDRIASVAGILKASGYAYRIEADSLIVTGDHEPIQRPRINTYSDHRIAMAAAILSLQVESMEIMDYQVVDKSWPGFWTILTEMGWGLEFR